MSKRNLNYYLNLNYDIIISKYITDSEVSFKAFTSELNQDAFYGVGDTEQKAIESLKEVMEELFEYYLENDISIPEPEVRNNKLPSGKFVLRTSPKLHGLLIKHANRNKQSLNQYIVSLLQTSITLDIAYTGFENKLNSLNKTFENIASHCPYHISNCYTFDNINDQDDGSKNNKKAIAA